jgi:multicopper oxidase
MDRWDLSMAELSRRAFLVAGAAALSGCSAVAPQSISRQAPALTPRPGQPVVTQTLRPRPARLDLGGVGVDTWAFADELPGPLVRARPGDLVRITVKNRLPTDTAVHWHGMSIRNAAAGIPDVTQEPIAGGATYRYEFVAPRPGTYFYVADVGVQSDRGLYAPMIVDDPDEEAKYDDEWIIVLDDWIDGTGSTPEELLEKLAAGGAARYPHYLVNGRVPRDPAVFRGRRGDRIKIRLVNAASRTGFAVALAGHRMTIDQVDGFAVQPEEVAALNLGVGERCDVMVTLREGAFPLIAKSIDGAGRAEALVRTSRDRRPARARLDRLVRRATDLDTLVPSASGGQEKGYRWTINGEAYGDNAPVEVDEDSRVSLKVTNKTDAVQSLHVQGHTIALESGLRKDVVVIAAGQTQRLSLQTDNPGRWLVQSQDPYRAHAGMRIGLDYRG